MSAAREARERMAEMAKAARKREADTTADLTAYLQAAAGLAKAAGKRDAAIAAADQTYRKAEAAAREQQAGALRRIRDRGATDTEIATLTGLEIGKVRALLKAGTGGAGTERPAATAAAGSPGPG